jgi:hypothetical protein
MSSQRFLSIYSGVLTMVFAATLLSGFASRSKPVNFDEINVRRINIIEPDGTLRMVMSNKAQSPGLIVKGKVESYGHLSFDQYQQDQVFTVDAGEEDGRRRSGVGIWDRGNYPIMEAFEASVRIRKLPPAEQEAEMKKFIASHPGDAQRAYLGRG